MLGRVGCAQAGATAKTVIINMVKSRWFIVEFLIYEKLRLPVVEFLAFSVFADLRFPPRIEFSAQRKTRAFSFSDIIDLLWVGRDVVKQRVIGHVFAGSSRERVLSTSLRRRLHSRYFWDT
ncbi:MAG: hypothetical protein H0T45_05150 [Pyrinomonadaceae bacterium]|nr:hypothetical protein [Pyrinomonadaceae bacterium]MDQ3254485.1 hypothetical protein [Acidobacteriota bacterium]